MVVCLMTRSVLPDDPDSEDYFDFDSEDAPAAPVAVDPQIAHLAKTRQAIEENFILDVLHNYMTYKAYYALEKAIEEDPKFTGQRASRSLVVMSPACIGHSMVSVGSFQARPPSHSGA